MLLFAVLRESTKYLNRNPSSLLITICQTLSVYELIRNEPKGPDFHTWYFLRNHWLIGYYWLRLGLRLLLLCLAHSSRWSSTIFSKNWYAIHTYVQWSMIWQQYIPMLLISYVQQYAQADILSNHHVFDTMVDARCSWYIRLYDMNTTTGLLMIMTPYVGCLALASSVLC